MSRRIHSVAKCVFRPALLLPLASFFATAAFANLFVTVIWLASEQSNGTAAVATSLSVILLGASIAPFLFGVFADRFSGKANILAIFAIVTATAALTIWLSAGQATLDVTTIAFACGFAREAWRPVWRAIVFTYSAETSLLRLNGAISASNRLGELVGALLGGVTLMALSPAVVLAVPIGLLGIANAIVLLVFRFFVRQPPGLGPIQNPTPVTPFIHRSVFRPIVSHFLLLLDGVRFIFQSAKLVMLLAVLVLLQMSIKLANLAFAPLVHDLYTGRSEVYGTMEACFAVGAFMASMVIASPAGARMQHRWVPVIGILLLCASYISLPHISWLPVTLTVMALMGVAFGSYLIVNTLFQQNVGERYQGRCASTIHFSTNIASASLLKLTSIAVIELAVPDILIGSALLALGGLLVWLALQFLPSLQASPQYGATHDDDPKLSAQRK
ncbi:MFS transporter (plasmid) [Phaeobacter sp. BS23]|uniref:MFS transporter n=1 Tax=Phaeobacter sp. BS23 TaxID=2907239 RepID=UPI00386AF980